MEVLNEREEGEVMGMEQETAREKGSHQSHFTTKPLSPTSSDSNSCVSSESCSESNFEYFAKMGTNNITTNGENHKVAEVITPLIEEGPAEKVETFALTQHKILNFEDITVTDNDGTNSFSVHQNGSSVVHSLHESNGGGMEIDVRSNGSTFSKSPDTAVGLKYFESLLDESFSGDAENGIVSQNQNAGVHQGEELEPEVEEYDVERVIQKQETHDLYCPNCRSCITKRVILRRRKRKIQEISTAEEASGSVQDQSGLPVASKNIAEESQQSPQVGTASDSRLDAISCFTCFSIFIPSGEGFLCWRFKPKADTARQPDGTSSGVGQAEDSKTNNTGTIFPLWVVTCCQPAERKKSDTEASPRQTEPPFPPSDDVPVSSTPGTLVPEHSSDTPIPNKSELATGRPYIEGTQHGVGTTLQNKPLNLIKPYGDTPSSETPSNLTTDEGSNFPLWILTCCQPSTEGTKMDHPVKLDGTEPTQETPSASSGDTKPDHPVKPGLLLNEDETTPPRKTPSAPSGGAESDHLAKPDGTVPQKKISSAPSGDTRPPLAPSDDNPLPPFKPESPAIFVPGTSSSFKPITSIKPIDEYALPPQTYSPTAPGNAVLPMAFKPQPAVIPSDTHGAESLVDVEPGLAREPRRHGVSGLDIIKATVYGGLLESITSLSVITSAAGGDATTLNIVALGLANVFGGLVVLIHNLRVLKHEHTSEHYEVQLGRPGHYMLHAIVAIVSYLVFGLMSPIIYGFSFRNSDNKDYKLATLAAAALACITLLSIAKAYVRNPPKAYIKTVFYYVSLGVMVSGLGYVAGDVINTLLKKFGVFDPRAADNVPVLAAGVTNGAWSSY